MRAARIEDVHALSAIGQASFRAAYEQWSEPDDLEQHLDSFFSSEAVRAEIQRPEIDYLIALVHGAPAGLVKICAGVAPDDVPCGNPLQLSQVYVMPEQQRYGVGARLIDAAAAFARQQVADGIWLSVWEDAPWAVNFYRKCGFAEVGVTDFKLGQSVYTDLLMWRKP